MQKSLSFFSALTLTCSLALLSACASGDTGSSPPRVPDSPALAQAKNQVQDIDRKISQAESELRQISPPIRTTSNGVTTFDADKQRQYENNRNRIDSQIRSLRGERTIWTLRTSQIIEQESFMAQQRAAQQAASPSNQAPVVITVPLQGTQENPAITQAKSKLRDIGYQISQTESSLRQLSPPIRTTTNGVTTFDVEKQRQYDLERARIDMQLRDLKSERTVWELRVNQLSQ